ncbi:hypothetical protein [Brevibacillus sp. SYP-B805]|uniref:hypothetical protein n=1 Tax=Brevibacillus sp. SYP-B805 TaxID=1578199 RepID=UPI001F4987FB|nr:hypothetical protein [Brevibacillus sp. SYP-B805]
MMKRMYGVELQVPSGKLPGFYAQMVHKIGDTVKVFDRDQQLMIVESEAERDKLMEILEKHRMAGDLVDLWLLPAGQESANPDYGFVSLSGNSYLLADLVAFFQFNDLEGSPQDRWAALEQMNEHVVASLTDEGGRPLYIVDRSMTDLIDGIARAYRVSVQWMDA